MPQTIAYLFLRSRWVDDGRLRSFATNTEEHLGGAAGEQADFVWVPSVPVPGKYRRHLQLRTRPSAT